MGTGAVRANERCDCMDIHGFDPSVHRDARTAAEEHVSFSDTNGIVRWNQDEVGNILTVEKMCYMGSWTIFDTLFFTEPLVTKGEHYN